jgi:hypothetical protein
MKIPQVQSDIDCEVVNSYATDVSSIYNMITVDDWLINWLIDWYLTSSEQFSALFRTRTFKNLSSTGLETRKGDGYGRIILPVQQVSYGPLIMNIMLIMICFTGFFNVRRGWQSLNTGRRFYLRLICRTSWLWIFTSRTNQHGLIIIINKSWDK